MRRRRPRGLSLIEIVVVIAIVASLMSAVAVAALSIHIDSLRKIARTDCRTLENALDMYRMNKGRYPDPQDGLLTLVTAKLVKEVPVDPWGHAYGYALQDGAAVVISYGADGLPGGDGSDADLSSRTTE